MASGRKNGSIDAFAKTMLKNNHHKQIAQSHQINLYESLKSNAKPFVSASKMSGIHPHKMMVTNESIMPEESSHRKVVNNIFISNLNINLNLNINISIPPSPRSTRNHNASYMESYQSNEADISNILGRKKSKGSGDKMSINLASLGNRKPSVPNATD